VIRYTLQFTLYGLTAQRRSQAVATVQDWLTTNATSVTRQELDANHTLRGETFAYGETDFVDDASGQSLFNTARNGAIAVNAGVSPAGSVSEVKFLAIDDVARTLTLWHTMAPGWPQVTAPAVTSFDD
jgi:hypothetical protein